MNINTVDLSATKSYPEGEGWVRGKSTVRVMNEGLGDATDIIGILVSVIVVAAMLVWVERRLLALWQDRLGRSQ